MDTITRLFQLLRVRGTAYFSKVLAPPWGIEVTAHDRLARFHLVVAGTAWIKVPGTTAQEDLSAGDLVIVPHGRAHILADRQDRAVTIREPLPPAGAAERAPLQLIAGTPGSTVLLCGYFHFAEDTPLALVTQLPDLLVTRDQLEGERALVGPAAELAASELVAFGAGSELVLDRLTEILFVHAVRHWAKQAMLPDGVLNGLADERLQRVITAIHDRTEEPWSVDRLARLAGQSRTAFATGFRAAIGVSPMDYLVRRRIELARQLLAQSRADLATIAERTGYADPNALTRAFKRVTGLSPSAFRRAARR